MTQFFVYDVFTDTAFGGNQLAVIPDATGLAEDDLQRIAREFNFSETTFVYPPNDPANTARVRIYTAVNEIPFAGHPTVGTAIALAQTGHGTDLILELGVGPIPCKVTRGEVDRAQFTTKVPMEIIGHPDLDLVAACIGTSTHDIKTDNHAPVMASCGLPFVLIELNNLDTLANVVPNTNAYQTAEAAFPNQVDLFATFAYVRNGDQVNARMFAPLSNMSEDPATGSAAAALGAYLTEQDQTALKFTIHQGIEMGRPSFIDVTTTLENTHCTSVTIGGAAVKTMEGQLTF